MSTSDAVEQVASIVSSRSRVTLPLGGAMPSMIAGDLPGGGQRTAETTLRLLGESEASVQELPPFLSPMHNFDVK